jgi:hypothetical protein
MKPPVVIITALLVAVAVISFVFVRIEAGQGGTLVLAQRSAERLSVAGVERVVRTAPENSGGPRGLAATCTSQTHTGLRNPWHCTIRYAGGLEVRYTVQIRLSGSYTGRDQIIDRNGQISRGNAQISGCCIVVP